MMRLVNSGVIGAIFGALIASCTTTDTGVVKKVERTQTFAMIGQENSTDQNIINIFKTTDTLIIKSGGGGELDGMMKTLAYLDEHPEKTIVIDGECASACTMLLSRPHNVVFTENASFLFHSAYYRECENGFVHFHRTELGNDRMASVFDGGIQSWILSTRAFDSLSFSRMSFEEAAYYAPRMVMKSSKLPKMKITNNVKVITDKMPTTLGLAACE